VANKLGQSLQTKRGACVYGTVAIGIPMWFVEIWFTWDFSHSVRWVLFLGVVSLVAGLVWGWAMWHVMGRFRAGRRSSEVEPTDK
jgi:hypothetical protein